MLSIVAGCAAVGSATDKAKDISVHVQTLKTKGCDALPEAAQTLLVALIKSRIEHYPKNGICDPDWVRDVLLDKLDLKETINGIHNQSTELGYSPDSWNRQLDQPEASGLPLDIVEEDSKSSRWLPDRSGVNPEIASLVYESKFKTYSGAGSNTRLLLYASMPGHDQATGRSNHSGGNGLCSLSGSNVETKCSLSGGSIWWQGQLVNIQRRTPKRCKESGCSILANKRYGYCTAHSFKAKPRVVRDVKAGRGGIAWRSLKD